MPKRRAKRTTKEPPASLESKHETLAENQLCSTFSEQEVERRAAAIRAIGNGEIEYTLSHLHNLRSFFAKEQLETPFVQFIEEKCPNIVVVKHDECGECLLHWKALDCNPSLSVTEERAMLPLLGPCGSVGQQGFLAYNNNCGPLPPFCGFPFSVAENMMKTASAQIPDFGFQNHERQIRGIQDSFETPGVSAQRLSIGMTPKTLRLPKPGEMLLSIHGSPLGVFPNENMEAIDESQES
ncbi:uncharacterized protein LOC18440213 isoform X1 [Amborella trichopoda]|nr:uncharacterized protein LOC18440213 isoform X1 [Amborella trichopoda]XP_020526588.1 uncharacterized protein LOC18440213 isoform X1 [Amborella trichopoda]XP_020526589.1 uncharacterized protein LOC18440213 isoform X1 [Amborella trichopoda]XP_020526590.1 uncharacterized protein LOC18440213 isoform X1 [Amborella trichopoda]XP_020526591.1 uncharacterized protein LOC18440213 isoform X1 [Amborella trichopoda]|eukprot:XP_006850428.2 uncharacterized protein LOC18440213 isoform X1 [Amborella trichopoda]